MTLVAGIAIAGPELTLARDRGTARAHARAHAARRPSNGPPPPSSICSIARAGWASSCRSRSTPEVFELRLRQRLQAIEPLLDRKMAQARFVLGDEATGEMVEPVARSRPCRRPRHAVGPYPADAKA